MSNIYLVSYERESSNYDMGYSHSYYPCDSEETAKALFERLKQHAIEDITEWSRGEFDVEYNGEDTYSAQYNYWEGFVRVMWYESKLIEMNEIERYA